MVISFSKCGNYFERGEPTIRLVAAKYQCQLSVQQMVYEYRFHEPIISLVEDAKEFLQLLIADGKSLGLLTGRTQQDSKK